jgi:hypothetical protein
MDVLGIARIVWRVKSMKTPIFEGNRVYRNFISPHEGLDGKMPAEMAGIGVSGECKWMELIKRCIIEKRVID